MILSGKRSSGPNKQKQTTKEAVAFDRVVVTLEGSANISVTE